MNIRTAEVSDCENILKLSQEVRLSTQSSFYNWPEMTLRQELNTAKTLLIEDAGQVLCFLCYRESDELYEIMLLATAPSKRRLGLQSRLIKYLQADAAKRNLRIMLEVHSSNTGAIELYKKWGFQVLNNRKNYYSDGADALIMSWSLIL